MLRTSSLPTVTEYEIPENAIRCEAIEAGCRRFGRLIPAGRYQTIPHHLVRGETVCICAVGQDPSDYDGTFFNVRAFELRRFQVEG